MVRHERRGRGKRETTVVGLEQTTYLYPTIVRDFENPTEAGPSLEQLSSFQRTKNDDDDTVEPKSLEKRKPEAPSDWWRSITFQFPKMLIEGREVAEGLGMTRGR